MTGPVEILVFTVLEPRVPPEIAGELTRLVEHGAVTVLDLIVLVSQEHGGVRIAELDEDTDRFGLALLPVTGDALLSADDLRRIRDGLPPGASAVVVVYEHIWISRMAGRVGATGGQVALHVRVPAADVAAAYAAAIR